MPSSQDYMFTLWQVSEDDRVRLLELPKNGVVKFIVFQRESAPSTGRLHFQGFIRMRVRSSMRTVKQVLCSGDAHLEPRKGSVQQAYDYATKEATRQEGPWQAGKLPELSNSNTLEEVSSALVEGSIDLEAVARQNPSLFVRHHRGLRALLEVVRKPVSRSPRVVCIVGPPGTGKSYWAHNAYPEAYRFGGTRGYWDGYSGQRAVIFDDFHGGHPFRSLLNVLDVYPCYVDMRGCFAPFCGEVIIFTSNVHPHEWYSLEVHQSANWNSNPLCRRIHHLFSYEVPEINWRP